MKALPDVVYGAIRDYAVQIVERVDAEDSAGEHDSLSQHGTIKIKAILPDDWRWQTFFHELLHMVEEEQHLDLTEDVVERISLGLYACWRRNNWALPAKESPDGVAGV